MSVVRSVPTKHHKEITELWETYQACFFGRGEKEKKRFWRCVLRRTPGVRSDKFYEFDPDAMTLTQLPIEDEGRR